MFAKSIKFVLFILLIGNICPAASIDSQFADSDAMFEHAHGLLFEYNGETAANLLKIAQESLAELNKAQNGADRSDAAMDALFAAVYTDMQNNLPYPPKDESLQKKIDACIAEAGKILGISENDPKYPQTARDYLNGKLPDRCGINKGVTPVTGDINMIALDNGIGQTRTMYYHKLKNADGGLDCGAIQGSMCFKILHTIPVTPALKQSGIQDDSMTFIDECVVPD